jgi:hypothetical protein
MKTLMSGLRRYAAHAVVVVAVTAVYGMARMPAVSSAERATMAARFAFERHVLPELNQSSRLARAVHPSMRNISAWVSSVGASVALADLDGDGLPDDVCHVDTRSDQVVVASVPGTPARFAPFELNPATLPYDSATMAPMGCLPGDFNEDGLEDVLVYYWGRTPILFMHRARQSSPAAPLSRDTYVARELMPTQERWNTNCATQADLDGDGHIDLIIGNYFPDGARVLDANADGREQMVDSFSRAFNGGRDRLLLWSSASAGAEPAAQFNEAKGALSEEVAKGWTLGAGAADLDGDMLPEIYFANDFGPDRLLHNVSTPGHLRFELLEGEQSWTTPHSKVLGHDSFKGMGVDFGDVNGDGLLDIYVSNIADEYALEESHFVWVNTGRVELMKKGIAPFVERSEQLGLARSGWGWDARLVDFDNDGAPEAIQAQGFARGMVDRWPELHEVAMSNDQLQKDTRIWPRFQPGDDLSGHGHGPFFVRASDGRYYDLAPDLNLDQQQITRGIAIADVNGDGRLDFALANQWMSSYVYLNEGRQPGSFLGLNLILPTEGDRANVKTAERPGNPGADLRGYPAVGAHATLYLPDGRRMVAQVDGGTGHSGKRSPGLHFGLGRLAADTPLRVDLDWRDAQGRQHHETLRLNAGWHTVLLGS